MRQWTEEEVQTLIEKYPTSSPKELTLMFPDRSYKAIVHKAFKLKLYKTKKEIQPSNSNPKVPHSKYSSVSQDKEIVRLYIEENLPMWKVAERLGISVGKVFNRLHTIGVKPKGQKDYPKSNKTIEKSRQTGKLRKGTLMTDEAKIKLAESKFVGGIGHKKLRSDGYISIYFPEHPMATNDGYILEHELIMSCVLGRHLEPDEVVHHKNHIRDDNRVCNLQVMTRAEHAALHMKERHEIQKRIKENNYEY